MTETQVGHEHYDFAHYVTPQRWASYREQVRVTVECKPRTVLYVGAGDNIVPSVLRAMGCQVTCFDYDAGLNVDIVGDVRQIETLIPGQQFDCIVCCQVLEHLPFEDFEKTLAAMCRLARLRVVISLPYCHKHLGGFSVQLPKLPKLSVDLFIPIFWRPWKFDGQHYWEIGAKNHSLRRIDDAVSGVAKVVDKFFVRGYHYHRFYILKA